MTDTATMAITAQGGFFDSGVLEADGSADSVILTSLSIRVQSVQYMDLGPVQNLRVLELPGS